MKKKRLMVVLICVLAAAVVAGGIFLVVKRDNKGSSAQGEAGTAAQSESAVPSKKIKIACVGDSITFGYALPNREKDAYPSQLAALLGENYEVKNFGITGRTVSLAGDFPYAMEEVFEKSKLFGADIVIFMLGTNDSKKVNWDKAQFANDYDFLIESYRAMPNHAQVYVMTPPPVFFEPGGEDAPDNAVITREIVPFIKQYAKDNKLSVIDVNAAFQGKGELFSDGCHPNEAGAQRLAQIVQQAISEKK